MKIFKAIAKQIKTAEIMVLAKNISSAESLVAQAMVFNDLDFEGDADRDINVEEIQSEDINDIIRDIKEFGILNNKAKIDYDQSIIDEVVELYKKQKKEEYLKKYHMEFNYENT